MIYILKLVIYFYLSSFDPRLPLQFLFLNKDDIFYYADKTWMLYPYNGIPAEFYGILKYHRNKITEFR